MGESKLIAKFHRLCDGYKADCVIDGVVESFDAVYPIPPERTTRGMILNLGKETRYVGFYMISRPPVEVGERVLVVGSGSSSTKSHILPAVILNPSKKWVLFSKERLLKEPDKRELAMLLGALGVIIIGLLLSIGAYYSIGFVLIVTGYVLASFPSWIFAYLRRSRLFHCSDQDCFLLMEEIRTRFGSGLNEWSGNPS